MSEEHEKIPEDDSDIYDEGPEFSQEYESPEDVYAEQEAEADYTDD